VSFDAELVWSHERPSELRGCAHVSVVRGVVFVLAQRLGHDLSVATMPILDRLIAGRGVLEAAARLLHARRGCGIQPAVARPSNAATAESAFSSNGIDTTKSQQLASTTSRRQASKSCGATSTNSCEARSR